MFTNVISQVHIDSLHDQIPITLAEVAEWMSYFNEQKAKATALQQQIDATDKQIDARVYELYGLTEEEDAVVEGARTNYRLINVQ